MRFLAWSCFLLGALSLGVALPLGCSASGNSGAGAGGGKASSGAGHAGGAGGDIFTSGTSGDTLTIQPPTATILVDNGVSMPITFQALDNGQPVAPTWSVDYGSIATVDAGGVVTATNTKGGTVKLTATMGNLTATADVIVKLKAQQNPGGIAPGDQTILQTAVDPDPTTQWAYPYDKTVFPRGLAAPDLMWNNGGQDDLYYIHYLTNYADFEIYTKAAPPSLFQLDDVTWQQISESGKGVALKLHVARLVPGAPKATVVVDQDWTISRGSLRGTVYYWANSLGRVVRIKPGAKAPDDFLAAAGVGGCSTCHTVSANGSTLIIGGDTNTSTFDLINNTPVLDITTVGKPIRNWAMPAVSPSGKYLVENNAPLPGPPGGNDGMWDTKTGMKITGTGLDGVYLDMPAFGPSGHHLAYVDHGGSHDLGVFAYDEASNQVTSPVTLVPAGADPNLNAIAFPSVSPTVQSGASSTATWIVYHRGQYPGSLDTRTGPGDLYLASADMPGMEIRLAAANGDNYPFAAGDRDRHYNYEPFFDPLASGGYMWVVFTSRRTYGNRLTGTKDVTKQLWVTAIDLQPTPGTDPSHPAFWVPGQDQSTLNMRGFWSNDSCVQQGNMCTKDSDCCDGEQCQNGLCGGPKQCTPDGNDCQTNADCCGGQCINGACGGPPPH